MFYGIFKVFFVTYKVMKRSHASINLSKTFWYLCVLIEAGIWQERSLLCRTRKKNEKYIDRHILVCKIWSEVWYTDMRTGFFYFIPFSNAFHRNPLIFLSLIKHVVMPVFILTTCIIYYLLIAFFSEIS